LQQNLQSNIQPQIPAQPNSNPNNRLIQLVQIIEGLDLEVELRDCNELKLRSRHIIVPDKDKNLQPEEPHPNKPLTVNDRQGEDTVRQKTPEQIITTSAPFELSLKHFKVF